jgi:hypothetical protein
MRSRSFGRTFTGRLERWDVLDGHGQAGDHVADAVRGGGDTLVDAAERVAEAQAHLRGRMHAGADLVGHDDEREAPLGEEVRQPVGRGQDVLLFVAAQEGFATQSVRQSRTTTSTMPFRLSQAATTS